MKPITISFTNSLGKLYNKWFSTIQKYIYNAKMLVFITIMWHKNAENRNI